MADVSVLDQPHDALKRVVAEYHDRLSQDTVMPAYPTALGVALRPSLVLLFLLDCPTAYLWQGSV